MRTPRPSSLKERCLAAVYPKDRSASIDVVEWLAGQALQHHEWTEDALSALTGAVELCAIILVEEYGARQNEEKPT